MRTEHFDQIMDATDAFFAVENAHPHCPHVREFHGELGTLREMWRPLMDAEQNATLDARIIALGGGTNK